MSPLASLVGFALWALFLVTLLAGVRAFLVLTKKKRAGDFPAGVQHGGDAYWRLNRAHINTVENLPIYAALVFAAQLLHVDVTLIAEIGLVARIVQSLIHISSGSVMAVNLRFTAFLTQVGCYVAMIVKLYSATMVTR